MKSFMKNPMFVIGVLMMLSFVTFYGQQFGEKMGLWSVRKRLLPTSCRALMVKLERRLPANWKALCEDNNLAVEINYPVKADAPPMPPQTLCPLLYRETANYLKALSNPKVTPTDNLERTDIVRLKIIHPQITINAISEGKNVAKLFELGDPAMLADHLKVTVQVREDPETCGALGKKHK